MENLIKSFGMLVLTVCTSVLTTVWSGYVVSILWGWFIVKTFALQPLSIPQAIGLSFIISYFTHQANFNQLEKEVEPWVKVAQQVAYGFLKPLLALFFGWVINHWM